MFNEYESLLFKRILFFVIEAPVKFIKNTWFLLSHDLTRSAKDGLSGPTGPAGMMGPPADHMYRLWLEKHPGGSLDEFIHWFQNKLLDIPSHIPDNVRDISRRLI